MSLKHGSAFDCKYKGNNITFIFKSNVIIKTENVSSSETTTCPECDSINIERPESPKIEFYGYE